MRAVAEHERRHPPRRQARGQGDRRRMRRVGAPDHGRYRTRPHPDPVEHQGGRGHQGPRARHAPDGDRRAQGRQGRRQELPLHQPRRRDLRRPGDRPVRDLAVGERESLLLLRGAGDRARASSRSPSSTRTAASTRVPPTSNSPDDGSAAIAPERVDHRRRARDGRLRPGRRRGAGPVRLLRAAAGSLVSRALRRGHGET